MMKKSEQMHAKGRHTRWILLTERLSIQQLRKPWPNILKERLTVISKLKCLNAFYKTALIGMKKLLITFSIAKDKDI